MPSQPAWFHRLDEILTLPADEREQYSFSPTTLMRRIFVVAHARSSYRTHCLRSGSRPAMES